MKEYIDLYDNYRNNTGKKIPRGEKIEEGFNRLIIHAAVFNDKGEMIIQKRQKSKKSWPNLWDISVSGAVSSGETSQVAVARELFEEISFEYDFKNIHPDLTIKSNARIDDIYIIKNYRGDIKNLKLQKEEVSDLKRASLADIKEMIKKGDFVPYSIELLEFLFYLKDHKDFFIVKK